VTKDKLLIREISVVSKRADAMKPNLLDLDTMARFLSYEFPHRSRDEVKELLQRHFEDAGLSWKSAD
jgi:hypothetical protein